MFNNIYILKVKNKVIFKKLIRYHIYFEKVLHRNDYYLIYIDYFNYQKLRKYQKVLEIELVDIKGINKYYQLLKKYAIFFIFIVLGTIYLSFLSNIIFDVKIMTNDKEIYDIIHNELEYYDFRKYHFMKSYNDKERIKKLIINDNKDKLEWIEIDRVGSTYNIYVERRIINDLDDDNNPRHVVARKNAIILEIKASNGSIIRKVNDYVNKGDIIVTGLIMKGDKVVNKVKADATIYGETWYNVHVELPLNYYDKTYTGRVKKKITINYFNKRIKLFNFTNYLKEEVNDFIIYENSLLPISLSYTTYREITIIEDIYTDEKALEIGINLAREKLLTTLPVSSKIMSQKKLKLYEKDSKIILEVFFRVYENITDYIKVTE